MTQNQDPVETEVEVTLGRSSAGLSRNWHLQVTDRRSRLRVANIVMDNDTFADMMSSTMAGRLAHARLFWSPFVGRYVVSHLISVDTSGRGHGKELERWLEDQAAQYLNLGGVPVLDEYEDQWRYAGFSGGGGGSRYRHLHFVRYTDVDPAQDKEGA